MTYLEPLEAVFFINIVYQSLEFSEGFAKATCSSIKTRFGHESIWRGCMDLSKSQRSFIQSTPLVSFQKLEDASCAVYSLIFECCLPLQYKL
jgi:hypothetical protein